MGLWNAFCRGYKGEDKWGKATKKAMDYMSPNNPMYDDTIQFLQTCLDNMKPVPEPPKSIMDFISKSMNEMIASHLIDLIVIAAGYGHLNGPQKFERKKEACRGIYQNHLQDMFFRKMEFLIKQIADATKEDINYVGDDHAADILVKIFEGKI